MVVCAEGGFVEDRIIVLQWDHCCVLCVLLDYVSIGFPGGYSRIEGRSMQLLMWLE